MENHPIILPSDLLKLSNQGDTPFGLLLNDDSILEIDCIVRRVPGKRLVCLAKWKAQVVYAKLFMGEGAKRYAERDQRGVEYLQNAHIASPKILHTYALNNVIVLIFEAITNSQNAELLWQSSTQNERKQIANLLARTVAQHHRANLMQTDLYLKNFLLQVGQVYTIDGDGVRKFQTISRAQATENFAVLVSKFDVVDAISWLASLLESYHAVNPDMQLNAQEVLRISSLHRTQVAHAYAVKKVFRQCTDVYVKETSQYFSAVASQYAHLDLPTEASVYDDWIQSAQVLKSGHTCTVGLMTMGQASVVIKRYNIKNMYHAFGRMFRKSRAAISWSNAHRLNLLGLATPKPIALLEERSLAWFRGKAYFVSEYLDAPDVKTFFTSTTDKLVRAEAVKQIVLLFYRLHLLKISHGDMKASNIKVLENKPVMIDLDSMRQHRFDLCANAAHVRDLKRFMRNWKDDVSLYNAFVKTFKVVYPDILLLEKAGISTNLELSS
jgi:tRNA A-37 threonylcarbamoyl transferase component Bud32